MSYSENNSFKDILNRMLGSDTLANVDTRVGSVAYDSLSPVALELSKAYLLLDFFAEQSYLMTAEGSSLDMRALDSGIVRNSATYAQRVAIFKQYKLTAEGEYEKDSNGNKILVDIDIPIGSRFAIPGNTEITYKYIGKIDDNDLVECEQAGTIGNDYIGTILPMTVISNLIKAEITSTYKPAQDDETDEELRNRVRTFLNYTAFGGNVDDYIQKTNAIDGVGNTKVFPAWVYNGSVLLSIVDSKFEPATTQFIKNVKQQIDPEEMTGQGAGTAPIGHYVTVTTPVKYIVNINIILKTINGVTASQLKNRIIEIIEEYFDEVRGQFSQDVNLSIYRSRITERLLKNIEEIINVKEVYFNELDEDITLVDNNKIGEQYLPYVGTITVGDNAE